MSGKSWRDVLPVHPACDMIPPMSADELKELGEDIAKHGLKNSIHVWSPEDAAGGLQLFDGRSRLDAMEAVRILRIAGKVTLEYKLPTGEWTKVPSVYLGGDVDPFDHVLSVNVHRRHLDHDAKRKTIEEVLMAQPEKSDRQIAKQVKRDHKTVAAARAKLEDVGSIPHVEKRTDTKGRKQPSGKKPKKARNPALMPKCTQPWDVDDAKERRERLIKVGLYDPETPTWTAPEPTEATAEAQVPEPEDAAAVAEEAHRVAADILDGAKLPDNPIARAWHEATNEQRSEFALAYTPEINEAALEIPPYLRRTPA